MAVSGVGRCWVLVVVFVLVVGVVGVDPAGAVDDSGGAGMAAVGGFSDVGGGGVHAPAVAALEELGVFKGTECGDGLFCPGEPMLRWVMAVWLIRVLGEELPEGAGSRFADVDAEAWWAPFVEALADVGVTEGCATDPLRYCPQDPVTRAQMASFLVRAFRLSPAASVGFSDTGGSTHEPNVDALAAARVTAGCATKPLRYCPDEAVTRAQMATFLARAVGLVPLPKLSEGPPTVQVRLADASGEDADRFDVRVLFDEPVSGFGRDDVVVVNGRITAFGGSGHAYRVSVERWAEGTVVVAVPAGVADDLQGDPNTSSAPFVWGKNPGPWTDTWDRQAVLDSYRQEFNRRQPSPEFTGSIRDCKPGTTSQTFRDSMVRRVNWYRNMAGLEPVTENPEATAKAQAAALIMAAEGRWSHWPPPDWRCWTSDGYAGASSNLFVGTYGLSAVDGYIRDPGPYNLEVGHRSSILDPWVSQVSTGDVPVGRRANALSMNNPSPTEEDDPQLREDRGFVAWPPPGYVPARAVWGRWSFSLTSLSPSVTSENAPDLSDATVTMFDHSGQIPTKIIAAPLGQWLVWAVAGDTNSVVHPQPRSGDRCYTVTIRGVWIDNIPQTPYQYATCVLSDSANTSQWPQHVDLTLTASGSAQADRDALVALYNSADGPNWRSATNWNTDKPLDQWEGVSTEPDGRVTSLNLSANSLSGSIPKEIGLLAGLSRLDLSHNQLTGPIPKEIGTLTMLRFLSLRSNQLTGPIPKEVGNLTELRTLTLAFNELSGPIPGEVGNLANLWGLFLSHNQLSGTLSAEVGKLTNLEYLDLSFNQLTGSIPREVGKLTNLEYLGLSFNQLTGSIPREVGKLTNLEDLYLDNNQLTGSIPREIGKLTNLWFLSLHNNDLSGHIPAELGNLSRARLGLGGNHLTGCIPKNLEGNISDLDLELCDD